MLLKYGNVNKANSCLALANISVIDAAQSLTAFSIPSEFFRV